MVLLAYPLDLIVSNLLKKNGSFAHGELSVWNALYDGTIDSEIVIYGSSRALVHIDPEIIETSTGRKAYNLGIDGHNFWLQHLRHTILMKHNKKPKTIILSVDVRSFIKQKELYNSDQFLPYIFFNKEIKYYTESYKGFTVYDYHLPFIRYFGRFQAIKAALLKNSYLKRRNGYEGQDKVWNDDFKKAKANANSIEIELDKELLVLFDGFLLDCKRDDIRVVLVYTPEYIEGQKFMGKRNEIVSLIDSFALKHNVVYLDYSKDDICLEKKYFYNASHLNKLGAEKFTKMLSKDLVLLGN